MNSLVVLAGYVSLVVYWLWRATQIGAVVLGAWALVDALMRPPEHFAAADKRTKGFWIGVNAAGMAVVILMGWGSMLGLLGVVANAVYLAEVRPALDLLKPVRVRSQIRRPGEDGRSGRGGRRR